MAPHVRFFGLALSQWHLHPIDDFRRVGCWVGICGHVCVLRFARFQRVCEQMYLCPYSCALVPPKPPTNGWQRGRLDAPTYRLPSFLLLYQPNREQDPPIESRESENKKNEESLRERKKKGTGERENTSMTLGYTS